MSRAKASTKLDPNTPRGVVDPALTSGCFALHTFVRCLAMLPKWLRGGGAQGRRHALEKHGALGLEPKWLRGGVAQGRRHALGSPAQRVQDKMTEKVSWCICRRLHLLRLNDSSTATNEARTWIHFAYCNGSFKHFLEQSKSFRVFVLFMHWWDVLDSL